MTEGIVETDDGSAIPVRFDSICVHSDTPNAVDVATAVRGVVGSGTGSASPEEGS